MSDNKYKKLDIVWEDDDADLLATTEEETGTEKESIDFTSYIDSEPLRIASFRRGERVRGVIQVISDSEDVIVDLGAKSSGMIRKDELCDADGKLQCQEGDHIDAYVISTKGGEIILSKSMTQSAEAAEDLKNAQINKIPVRGKVIKENKGGFDVMVLGKTAFCPVSQMDLQFIEDKSVYIGKEFSFLIQKFENYRNIVVSRAALLVKEMHAKLEDLKKQLPSEEVFSGTVTGVKDFGLIVEAQGIEGLVHISEISFGRIAHPSEVYDKGDKVFVKILSIDDSGSRPKISMSIKKALTNPWELVHERFKIGEKYMGKVVRLEKFGAFVELTPGIEGLCHVSEMSWIKRIHHPSDVLKVGDAVVCNVLNIDETKKQLSLSLKDIAEDPWAAIESKYAKGQQVLGKVEKLKDFGAILALEDGVTGLLPISVIKKAFGESYRKKCSPPMEVDVIVADINTTERKILLTLPNIDHEEAAGQDYQNYLAELSEQSTAAAQKSDATLGALGTALLEKMKARR